MIFSEAWNISKQYRESGGYEATRDAITVFLEKRLSNQQQVPSYAYVIRSFFHTAIGAPRWRKHYEKDIDQAIDLLKEECPLSTWYDSTQREVIKHAQNVDDAERVVEKMKAAGIAIPE